MYSSFLAQHECKLIGTSRITFEKMGGWLKYLFTPTTWGKEVGNLWIISLQEDLMGTFKSTVGSDSGSMWETVPLMNLMFSGKLLHV